VIWLGVGEHCHPIQVFPPTKTPSADKDHLLSTLPNLKRQRKV